MRYNQQLNYQRRRKFVFRVRLFFIVLLVVLVTGGAYLYYATVNVEQGNTQSATTSEQTSGYFAPTVNVFRSPYFQFQANNTWAEVAAESTPNKYVYRSLRSNLIEHELVIYVNQIPADLAANRVLPANVKSDSELMPISVSEHCIKAAGGPQARSTPITLDRVKMLCKSDSTNYTVLVGQVDGSTAISLARPDGSRTVYSIYYSNLKANPDAAQLAQIVDSFQTR